MFKVLLFLALSHVSISAHANNSQCAGVFYPSGTRILRSEEGDRTVSKRTACFASGECTVYMNKPRSKRMPDFQLRQILGSNGIVLEHSDSDNPAVNCHSFSCQTLGIPNFPRNAWVDPIYFSVIIQEFFRSTGNKYSGNQIPNFAHDPAIQEGDLVLMLNFMRTLNHSGVVKRVSVGGEIQNWVLSKLEEGLIVLVPIENLLSPYQADHVLVYRQK